jgi:predicted permease
MGIPLINGIFGTEGVFYITAYLTVFNILIWTQGVIMMTGKQSVRSMVKTLVSPTIIATLLGFIFFVAKVHIPNTVYQSLDYVASMNTPFAMLIAGATIAQTNILKLFSKIRVYLVVFIKLLLIPAVMLIIYSRFNIEESVLTTTIVAAACPTAASGTLFALRYNKNALYASEIFALTTLFSMITIPIIMALTELIL